MTTTEATITFTALIERDERTLDGYRRQLAELRGDADATVNAGDGRVLTIVDDETGAPMWAAQAVALLGEPNPADLDWDF